MQPAIEPHVFTRWRQCRLGNQPLALDKLALADRQVFTHQEIANVERQHLVAPADRPVTREQLHYFVVGDCLECQWPPFAPFLVRVPPPLHFNCSQARQHQHQPMRRQSRKPRRSRPDPRHQAIEHRWPRLAPLPQRQPPQPAPHHPRVGFVHKRQVSRVHHQREDIQSQGEHRHQVEEKPDRDHRPLRLGLEDQEQERDFPHDGDIAEQAQHQRMLRQPVPQRMHVVHVGHGPVHQLVATEKRWRVHLGERRTQVGRRHQQLDQPGRPERGHGKVIIEGPLAPTPVPPGIKRPDAARRRDRQQHQQVGRDHRVLGNGADRVEQSEPGVESAGQHRRQPGMPPHHQ